MHCVLACTVSGLKGILAYNVFHKQDVYTCIYLYQYCSCDSYIWVYPYTCIYTIPLQWSTQSIQSNGFSGVDMGIIWFWCWEHWNWAHSIAAFQTEPLLVCVLSQHTEHCVTIFGTTFGPFMQAFYACVYDICMFLNHDVHTCIYTQDAFTIALLA